MEKQRSSLPLDDLVRRSTPGKGSISGGEPAAKNEPIAGKRSLFGMEPASEKHPDRENNPTPGSGSTAGEESTPEASQKQPGREAPAIPGKPSIPGKVIVMAVRFYQAAISPWLGPGCRHYPTCSVYMIEAVQEWGALKGTWMGLKRLSKCHPWGASGYDPVPRRGKGKGSSH